MNDWHVNEGLQPLIDNARSKFSGMTIYTIGDTAHQHEISDHNPNIYGRVNAADFMISASFQQSNAVYFSSWVIQDERTKYVIYNRRIWEDGKWAPYNGTDPHTNHVHVSVKDSAYINTAPWMLSKDDEMALSNDDKEWIKQAILDALNTPIANVPSGDGTAKWSLASIAKNTYVEAKNTHVQADKIVKTVVDPTP